MAGREKFYASFVARVLPNRQATVLVLAASKNDKEVFDALGFSNVTYSNVDELSGAQVEFSPAPFSQQDAEAISYPDGSFDYVVIHAALHHCHSPHRALLEMYRVAKKGVLAFEARDSALMRLLVRLHLTQVYENATVYLHGGTAGGVRNGPVPNYIYRWTEREVEKAIDCFAPHAIHSYTYGHGHDIPALLLIPGKRSPKQLAVAALYFAYRCVAHLFPRQQNLFAFMIRKPELPTGLQPWLEWRDGAPIFSMKWGEREFHNAYRNPEAN